MLINSPVTESTISNPVADWPSISTSDLTQVARIDKSLGQPYLQAKIEHAYDLINGQLALRLILPPEDDFARRTYIRAVIHEAAALISEEHLDFDSSGDGLIRGEAMRAKGQMLRRIVNHCIADLTSRPRNRVRLV